MGNRAIVKPVGQRIGVYLHWNGGRDSVEAFLKYCEMRGFRDFGGKNADGYGVARFIQVVSNFFGGALCVGLETGVDMDAATAAMLDNGIYEVDGWKIVARCPKGIREQREYKMQEMLEVIDAAQPREDRFGKRYLRAKEVPTENLRIGDTVYLYNENAYQEPKCKGWKVVGIGQKGKRVNGRDVGGVPYINRYPTLAENNINNYLTDKKYRATVKKR